jgi:molybdate/tungstate transport system substrate-binding protein
VRVGRTDPDQDPLGYRTLFTLELATEYYEAAPDLTERIPRREQLYPETALVSQFETGGIDAAFTYRNMAVERGYDYVALPDEINLSNPDHAARYASVSYRLPDGHDVHGDVISYASTVRKPSEAALEVFAAHTTGAYLDNTGFVLDGRYPQYVGDVPDGVEPAGETAAGNRQRVAPSHRVPTGHR